MREIPVGYRHQERLLDILPPRRREPEVLVIFDELQGFRDTPDDDNLLCDVSLQGLIVCCLLLQFEIAGKSKDRVLDILQGNGISEA